MILHIPHSSINTLDIDIEQYDIDELTDWYTDDLFQHKFADRLICKVSRFVCDVERFYDENEPMFLLGQGISYTKGTRNNTIKNNKELSLDIYKKWHSEFNKLIAKTLSMFSCVIVVDCHSFTSEPDDPDFCIGTNTNTPIVLINSIKKFIEYNGYSVELNKPFQGSIVPSNYTNDNRVNSIMIEVNKNLYLEEFYKSKDYIRTKDFINNILEIISEYENIRRLK